MSYLSVGAAALNQCCPIEPSAVTQVFHPAWSSWVATKSDAAMENLKYGYCDWESEFLIWVNLHLNLSTWTTYLKSRDITLPTKVCIVKAMVFPVVMHGCESWTKEKAERWGTDTFELWCWRRLLRVPWTARRSNQSTLKEINPEYSLEGLMLKPKLQYFGQLMWRTDSSEKPLMLGKTEDKRRRGQQRRWLDAHKHPLR